ncbi:UBX domain-containing protein 6 [Amphibalanus amphitrite]|uniref:UBX domain-containing protein 6 n=1 Tax=Amphibalanus amphitrite TaxID=1232801 RepID=A0A6A4WS02_AMPAM|nr:UBX domain-containing protein 6 [Amphibalanus amphitrite]KAF0310038.1 UBX domain-containing protein 6 [Amphibalanus amphitrite]
MCILMKLSMVWQPLWEGSLVVLQWLAALLTDVSDSAAAALNSSRPLVSEALQRAGGLVPWPDLGLPELDAFQANLLLAIGGILVTNVLLVYLAWSRYGERIVEHFTSADAHRSKPGARGSTMDALKKFIEKKKSEAKFKKAGPGHRLSGEPGGGSGGARGSASAPAPLPERQHPSKGSQLAGAAALARHEQKQQQQSASSRSLAVIRAQARKELDAELAATGAGPAEGGAAPPGPRVTELEMAPNLAVSGVYYRCPIIGGEVLPRTEIQQKIKLFLYEQLAEDGGIAACLIIHSCNANREKVQTGVETLCKYMENILSAPAEEKFRKIRQSNKAYAERVAPLEGAAELLAAAGFQSTQLPHGDGTETFWVFPPDGDLDKLQLFRDALVSAEPIVPELDRNARALMPAQAARQVALPADFFAISQEELKREQQLRSEGTFRVTERVSAVYTFVRENLVRPSEAFELLTPTGHPLDADDQSTLAEAKLVPSVLLTWQLKSGAAPPGGSTGAFLVPELMETISELG